MRQLLKQILKIGTMFFQTRSDLMSCIRSKGNRKTEIALMNVFRRRGVKGWRRHVILPGKPDFSFRSRKVAVFVDGCFWHMCPECYKEPKTNVNFWRAKLQKNRERDAKVVGELVERHWTVFRFWEHELAVKGFDRTDGFVALEVALQFPPKKCHADLE